MGLTMCDTVYCHEDPVCFMTDGRNDPHYRIYLCRFHYWITDFGADWEKTELYAMPTFVNPHEVWA